MQIVIDIPEKEFGIDIKDRFQDFFERLKAETEHHMISGSNLVCGAYELETIDMFLKAFNNSTPLPKGHGRLIDADKFLKDNEAYTGWILNSSDWGGENAYKDTLEDLICEASTIIEEDKEI